MSQRTPAFANEDATDRARMISEALLPAEPALVLLGPQGDGGAIGGVLGALGVTERVALITAGWQERETEDSALVGHLAALGLTAVNLRLHARSEEVLSLDKELAEASSDRQRRLKQVQEFYRIRLDYTARCARAISVRHVDADILEQESHVSVEQLRQLDRDHLERCGAIQAAFDQRWRVAERPLVAQNARALRALVEQAEAVVIAGGHVASLVNRLRLFDVAGLSSGKHVVACSAAAMALTDRIVLFHDFPPYGTGIAEVLSAGLGLVPDVVVLPDPRRRIDPADRAGIAQFARRMAPAACVALDEGAHLACQARRITSALGMRLTTAGGAEPAWRLTAPRDPGAQGTP